MGLKARLSFMEGGIVRLVPIGNAKRTSLVQEKATRYAVTMNDVLSFRAPSSASASDKPKLASSERISILDGWRAVSIMAVMAGHLVPLGPARWELNGAVAAFGMAIFFTLSGFLITRFLLAKQDVPDFLARRLFRIVPLAWAAMLILITVDKANLPTALSNLAFISNLPPTRLLHGGEHLWSLCVEMQFYVGVALLVSVFKQRGLLILPVIALCVTLIRIVNQAPISIFTYERLDEILAGATLALFYNWKAKVDIGRFTVLLIAPVAVLSAHGAAGWLCYARPYLVAAMVGSTLFAAPNWMRRLYGLRIMLWIAEISYGLYVLHAMLSATWLGSGEKLVKYAKRPLLIALTFVGADLSYRFYEVPARRWGQGLVKRFRPPPISEVD